MTPALTQALCSGTTLQDLEDRLAIKATRHKKYPNLVLFKYSMVDSPFSDPLVKEARGITLDQDNGWQPVCWGLNKFFNYGEGLAATIDWETAWVQEKMDGSLCQLYFYDNQWQVATSGSPDASGNVNGDNALSFKDLFWRVFEEEGYPLPSQEHQDLTLVFELTTPFNRVVVPHQNNHLHFLAARNRTTSQEHPVWAQQTRDELLLPKYSTLSSYPLRNYEEILATLRTMNPLEQEGYVVVDAHFNRVKIKSPAYVALHHMKDGFSRKRILEVIRSGESSELETGFISAFPEYKADFDSVKAVYKELVQELERDFVRIKHIQVQKDFAFEALKSRCPAALFQLRKGSTNSAGDFLSKIGLDKLMQIVEG